MLLPPVSPPSSDNFSAAQLFWYTIDQIAAVSEGLIGKLIQLPRPGTWLCKHL